MFRQFPLRVEGSSVPLPARKVCSHTRAETQTFRVPGVASSRLAAASWRARRRRREGAVLAGRLPPAEEVPPHMFSMKY